ncbi:MAG: chemotaxis protein CheD [Allgaiera sp.]|jgi:chemotaxis protein CheD|nr:chemotaxis protein CheD [Allgaiera sp.]
MNALPSETGQVHHVIQGNFLVSCEAGDTFATILGSCVATCLCDPVAGVGGMNHFLLPEGGGGRGDLLRYGPQAMELLINALLKEGARKSRLEAKLFGGAQMHEGLQDIGRANAAFAHQFLQTEGIALVSESLGGRQGRRVRYWPATGRAQIKLMQDYARIPAERPAPFQSAPSDDVTFF